MVQDQQGITVTKTEPEPETGYAGEGGDTAVGSGGGTGDGGGDSGRRERRRKTGVVARARREKLMVKRVGLGLRVWEFVICLVSFSVMAADKNRGWALDSFDHYTEFRCLLILSFSLMQLLVDLFDYGIGFINFLV